MESKSDDNHLSNIFNRCLDKNKQEIVDSLVKLESSISNMLALVYVIGHVQMKAGSKILDDTNFCCEKYSGFL